MSTVINNKNILVKSGINRSHVPLLMFFLIFFIKVASGQYHTDSVLVKNEIEKLERRFETKKPVGFVDINLEHLIGYNNYEGIKPGFGIETNNKLSNYFSIGGYITYGLKDKNIRHGEWINLFPSGNDKLRLHFGYRDQNMEIGGHKLLGENGFKSDDFFRSLYISDMYVTRRYSAGVEINVYKPIRVYFLFDKSENELRGNYEEDNMPDNNFSYNLSRAGFRLRYEPAVRSLWHLNFYHGLTLGNSDYDFTKIEFTGKVDLFSSKPGKGIIKLRTGKIWGNVPLPELFNGNGSYSTKFTFLSPFSFATMRMNEFMADMFASIHIRYIVAKLVFSERSAFRPEILVAHNMGTGILGDNFNAPPNIEPNDFSNGFYESGLELNNLIPYSVVNYGIGVYYRYGPYSFDNSKDNFAIKLGILFNF